MLRIMKGGMAITIYIYIYIRIYSRKSWVWTSNHGIWRRWFPEMEVEVQKTKKNDALVLRGIPPAVSGAYCTFWVYHIYSYLVHLTGVYYHPRNWLNNLHVWLHGLSRGTTPKSSSPTSPVFIPSLLPAGPRNDGDASLVEKRSWCLKKWNPREQRHSESIMIAAYEFNKAI